MSLRVRIVGIFVISVVASVLVAGPAQTAAPEGAPPYQQPIWFQWNRAEIDILVVPPNHGQIYNQEEGPLGGTDPAELTPTNSYLKAMERSIDAYRQAVHRFGPRWLNKGLKLRSYVLGRDDVPTEALQQPEIIVVTDETKASTLGIAINTKDALGQDVPCIVNNSKLMVSSFTYADMYNVMGQEFGHCLGLDHVTGGSPGDQVLAMDLLNGTYPHQPGAKGNPFHCLSNMNTLGLKVVFAPAFGKSIPFEAIVMEASRYKTMDCHHSR